MKEEICNNVTRQVMNTIDMDVLTSAHKAFAAISAKPYPVKEIRTSKFVATWYGKNDPDAKVLLYTHGQSKSQTQTLTDHVMDLGF